VRGDLVKKEVQIRESDNSHFLHIFREKRVTTSFSYQLLSTAIALQTGVVVAQGLRVWTVYIMKCSARRLQQLYGVPIVLYGDDFGVDNSGSWYSFAAVDS
ncbi:hypothetical protein Tco_1513279, partial [Tanacetum coccineum]